jgi:hypothetical protein
MTSRLILPPIPSKRTLLSRRPVIPQAGNFSWSKGTMMPSTGRCTHVETTFPGDLGIGVHARERLAVGVPPAPEEEP